MPTASPASAETRSKISTTSICCKTWANIPFCPTTPPILSAPSSHVRPTHQETLPIASTLPITIGPTPTTCARQRNFFLVFFSSWSCFSYLASSAVQGRGAIKVESNALVKLRVESWRSSVRSSTTIANDHPPPRNSCLLVITNPNLSAVAPGQHVI